MDPVVTKEYSEDLGQRDPDGNYDYAYRYWMYWFDLGGRKYNARIYTDSPDEAAVTSSDATLHAQYAEDLQVIGAYLRNDAGIRVVVTLGASGGFEPTLAFDS